MKKLSPALCLALLRTEMKQSQVPLEEICSTSWRVHQGLSTSVHRVGLLPHQLGDIPHPGNQFWQLSIETLRPAPSAATCSTMHMTHMGLPKSGELTFYVWALPCWALKIEEQPQLIADYIKDTTGVVPVNWQTGVGIPLIKRGGGLSVIEEFPNEQVAETCFSPQCDWILPQRPGEKFSPSQMTESPSWLLSMWRSRMRWFRRLVRILSGCLPASSMPNWEDDWVNEDQCYEEIIQKRTVF